VVKVLGYDCVVPKDKYQGGEIIVFIQPDTVLPKDKAWANSYLKYCPTRVKATKLNSKFSIWSCGLVITLDELGEFNLEKYSIGTDVADIIGVTKYEAKTTAPNAIGGLPYGIPKTDEVRHNNLRDLPFGEIVDVTRKVDGSSCTMYYNVHTDRFGICSRTLELKLKRKLSFIERQAQAMLYKIKKSKFFGNLTYSFVNFIENKFDLSSKFTDNEFTRVAEQLDIENKLKAFCKKTQ
jgi:RNA ligase (TIGR02306 family)